MIEQSVAETRTTATTNHERGVCAGCGEKARALRAPRANVGTGYKGAMFCGMCNPRFKMLDFHASCLERLA